MDSMKNAATGERMDEMNIKVIKRQYDSPEAFMSDAEIAAERDCIVDGYDVEGGSEEPQADWPYQDEAGRTVRGKLHTF